MAPDTRHGFRRLIRAVAPLVILILLLPFALTLIYGTVARVSTVMLWRWITGKPVERRWVPLDRVSPALITTVIVAEDGRYCRHHGVDFGSVAEIIETEDLREARGGSSITQQTAKNLFLWPSRSFVRKVLELPLALWLDLVLGKRRGLGIYFYVAEWGPEGGVGVETGGRRAFRKDPSDLDRATGVPPAAVCANSPPRVAV